jgi:hypothetical protein
MENWSKENLVQEVWRLGPGFIFCFPANSNNGTYYRKMYLWITAVNKNWYRRSEKMAAGPWIPLSVFPVNSNKETYYRKM